MSRDIIPKSLDRAIDKANPPVEGGATGISIRNGPMEEMDIDEPPTNGNLTSKRKARSSMTNGRSYKEASDEEEEDEGAPLVSLRAWT